MITKDQPTIFGSDVIAAVSSVSDGNMKFGVNPVDDIAGNRRRFLQASGIAAAQAVLVEITYDMDDFAKSKFNLKRSSRGCLFFATWIATENGQDYFDDPVKNPVTPVHAFNRRGYKVWIS